MEKELSDSIANPKHLMWSKWMHGLLGTAYIRFNRPLNRIVLANIQAYTENSGFATSIFALCTKLADQYNLDFVVENAHNPLIIAMCERRGYSRCHNDEYSFIDKADLPRSLELRS